MNPNYSPIPTPYPTNRNLANPYVPVGTVGLPVSRNATPIASTPSGGTTWLGNTYGYTQTPYAASTTPAQPAPPQPRPVPTPTAPSFQYNDNGTAQAEEEARRREEQTRNEINSGYDSYISGLQGMQGSLGTAQTQELGSASNIYEQIFGGLNEQKATNLSKLDANRGAVNTRQAQSIKDLQQNLSNTLRNATMQFGAAGAGDSSATRVMLPYAYTKMAGAQEGSIRNQANDQLFQIDQDEKDTESQFSQMWRQTEVDKESQLQSIRNYYGEAIRNVQTAMAQAPLEKANSLASLNQSLLAEARGKLSQLETENRQRQENIKNWATQRMSELNNLKMQLSGSANFNPQDIVWNELSATGQIPAQTNQDQFFNPMLIAQKKRSAYLGQ